MGLRHITREEAALLGEQIDFLDCSEYNIDTHETKAGVDMAKERDYAKEYAREKDQRKARGEMMVGVKVTRTINEDFVAKCVENGTTKNAVLKNYIMRYTYENFDQ